MQPHLKSQVTQKLINQQSEDAMQQVCQQTLSRLKSGASEFYKCLEKEEKSPKKEQAAELKPTKRELLKPSSKLLVHLSIRWMIPTSALRFFAGVFLDSVKLPKAMIQRKFYRIELPIIFEWV